MEQSGFSKDRSVLEKSCNSGSNGTGHVLVTFITGHVIEILLEDSIRPLIRDRSKHKALRFESHDPSGWTLRIRILRSVRPRILKPVRDIKTPVNAGFSVLGF